MADNLNVVAIRGNLTRDPELKHVGDKNTAMLRMDIAVNSWFGKDYVSYFNVTLFGKQADAIHQYLQKGKGVAVQGKLKQDRWEQDGNNRSKVVIMADHVDLLPDGKQSNQRSSGEDVPQQSPQSSNNEDYVDDVPF